MKLVITSWAVFLLLVLVPVWAWALGWNPGDKVFTALFVTDMAVSIVAFTLSINKFLDYEL